MVLCAVAEMLEYLRPFKLENVLWEGGSFRPLQEKREMALPPNALRQLGVLQNPDDGGGLKGSLFWLMNRTKTPFGARLMHHWVAHPLCDRAKVIHCCDCCGLLLVA